MSELKKGEYKLFYILVDEIYVPIGCLTDNSFSERVDMLSTTTRQNPGSWKTSIPTDQGYSISLNGLVTTSDKEGTIISYLDLQNIKRAKTRISWKTENEQTGYTDYGYAYITSLSNNAPAGDFISFSASLVGWGVPVTTEDGEGNNLNADLNVQM